MHVHVDLKFRNGQRLLPGVLRCLGRLTLRAHNKLSFIMRSKRQPPEAAEHSRQESLAIPKFKINVNVHPPERLDAIAQLSLTARKPGLSIGTLELSAYR